MRGLSVVLVIAVAGCMPEQAAHRVPPPSEPVQSATLNAQDRDFLERAAQGNNAEVAIGGLLNGRATDPNVITFGQMMARDHAEANTRLRAIAAELKIALPTSLGEHQAGYDKLVDRKLRRFEEEFGRVMRDDHQSAVLLYQSEVSGGTHPLLRAYAAETLSVIQAHLAHAKTLPSPTN